MQLSSKDSLNTKLKALESFGKLVDYLQLEGRPQGCFLLRSCHCRAHCSDGIQTKRLQVWIMQNLGNYCYRFFIFRPQKVALCDKTYNNLKCDGNEIVCCVVWVTGFFLLHLKIRRITIDRGDGGD